MGMLIRVCGERVTGCIGGSICRGRVGGELVIRVGKGEGGEGLMGGEEEVGRPLLEEEGWEQVACKVGGPGVIPLGLMVVGACRETALLALYLGYQKCRCK